jgi:hypothetical protein
VAHSARGALKFVRVLTETAGHDVCEWLGRMSVVAELLIFITSIGLSVALARLAVGEMFRLVRITPRTPDKPSTH